MNVPLVCDGVLVEPGDIIAADDDGVLVISRRDLRQAVEGARERAAKEWAIKERLLAGEALFDILDMQRAIKAAGIEEREGVWRADE